MRTALRVQRRISGEGGAELSGEIEEVRARVNPGVEIRERDESTRGDVGVGALDDHVARGVHVDARGIARVRFEEPDHDGDVVADSLERHRDRPVRLEEDRGAAVVVSERRRFGLEGGVGGD